MLGTLLNKYLIVVVYVVLRCDDTVMCYTVICHTVIVRW